MRSSRSDPGESVPALRSGQSIGLSTICLLLERRRHIANRAELVEWRRQFREVVALFRGEDAEPGSYGTR